MSLRVIGAGVGRTGSTSLKAALEQLLGGPCYHMYEVFQHRDHIPIWHAAIGGDAPDWELIFGPYAATVDWPGASFWRSLSERYPDALVLLTTHTSTEAWFRSANSTINELLARRPPAELRAWHAMATELLATRFTAVPFDAAAAMAAYEGHNAEVRATVPAHRLLEWRVGDGWAPLCERLDLPVPDEPFPHLNTAGDYQELIESLQWRLPVTERVRRRLRR